jgi:hypothetical protein
MKKSIFVVWGLVVFMWGIVIFHLSATGAEKTLTMWEQIPQHKATCEKFTRREKQILLRIASAEAEGEGAEGMRKVLEVVLNRVKSPKYPNSIEEVVFQDYPCIQFESTENGRYEAAEITKEAYEAFNRINSVGVQDSRVIAFENVHSDTLNKWYEYLYSVGNHRFYCEKGGANG